MSTRERYNFIDMTGATLAGATVVRRLPSVNGNTRWACRLACGHELEVEGILLRAISRKGGALRCRVCVAEKSTRVAGVARGARLGGSAASAGRAAIEHRCAHGFLRSAVACEQCDAAEGKRLPKPVSRYTQKRDNGPRPCRRCGKEGHNILSCSMPFRCGRCGKQGHSATTCKTPRGDFVGSKTRRPMLLAHPIPAEHAVVAPKRVAS